MNIIQIVGYKNSGKTTLTTQLIELLTNKGIRTASFKHHGHGGLPLGIENKDSFKHQAAGAMFAGVEGEGMFQLTSREGWKFEQLIAIYKLFDMDVLVVEGLKGEKFPKIVIIKKEEDLALLSKLDNIIAVISDVKIEHCQYPLFTYQEFNKVCEFYIDNYVVGGGMKKSNFASD